MVQVPVGKETLGRIINVIGEPVDEQGPVSKPRAFSSALIDGTGHLLSLFKRRRWERAF